MTVIWQVLVPRCLGAVLCGFGLWFIRRNLFALADKGGRWSLRRVIYAACWSLIIGGYFLAGSVMIARGWSNLAVAGVAFALAMVAFIPVPCHYSIMNRDWRWRLTRAIFFAVAARLSLYLGSLA